MGSVESWAVETIDAVFELHRDVVAEFHRLSAGTDLTPALARALWAIDPGPISRRLLAQRLGCDPSNVTFLADRLVEQGLVRRVPDPDDRRVRAMQLTKSGRAMRTTIAGGLAGALRPGGVAADALSRVRTTLRTPPP